MKKAKHKPAAILGYKLTDADGYTRKGQLGETRWEVGKTVAPTGNGSAACGPGVLHDYASPLLAVLLNPVHADISSPRMFVVEHAQEPQTDGLKRWTTGSLQVLQEIAVPQVSTLQRVRWAVLVSLEVPQSGDYMRWARRWLSGEDRSEAVARAAAREARAARAAWAAWAAWAAARAAWEAAREAAREAAWAAWEAAREAWEAAREAWEAAIDKPAFMARLHELAEQAIREEP